MEKFLRRPYLPGICEGAEVPHQCGPVGRKGMEELLKFFLDLQSASLHSGLSSFCPYSYAIPCAHMQIEETVTSRVGAYGTLPPRLIQGRCPSKSIGDLSTYPRGKLLKVPALLT